MCWLDYLEFYTLSTLRGLKSMYNYQMAWKPNTRTFSAQALCAEMDDCSAVSCPQRSWGF